MTKVSKADLDLLARERTFDCLIQTVRPVNSFERNLLETSGCTLLNKPSNRCLWVRFDGRDAMQILNLGFVEQIEIVAAR
jgi:hypothetical protein